MKQELYNYVKEISLDLKNLSEYIYNNPELGNKEFKSSKAHIDLLNKYGFEVIDNYMDIPTAFRAEYKSKKNGPTIAFLSEYDALPGMGHGCGHNLLGAMSTGAGIALKKFIDEVGGTIVVLGTPAEESDGAKVVLVDKGVFDDIDIALMAHPEAYNKKSCPTLALQPIEFVFTGKAAHAASAPDQGINALDACILTFNGINALREHIKDSARIHGIIKEGGVAANIVPDKAVAQFYIRTKTKKYRNELKEKVINCAKAGALATGAKVEYSEFEYAFDNVVTNEMLSQQFTKNQQDVGVEEILEADFFTASVDMGNVSQVCPAIHAFVKVTDNSDLVLHTPEFRDETIKEYAIEAMIKTVYSLAKTGYDVSENKELLNDIKTEFENRKESM